MGFDSDFGKAHLPVTPRTLNLFGCTHVFMELELFLMLVFISLFVSRTSIVLCACIKSVLIGYEIREDNRKYHCREQGISVNTALTGCGIFICFESLLF